MTKEEILKCLLSKQRRLIKDQSKFRVDEPYPPKYWHIDGQLIALNEAIKLLQQ